MLHANEAGGHSQQCNFTKSLSHLLYFDVFFFVYVKNSISVYHNHTIYQQESNLVAILLKAKDTALNINVKAFSIK